MVDEARTIEKARDGDTRSFEAILTEYERPVFNAAYRVVGNHEDAADVTQAVFIKVFEKLGTYDPRYRFFSWVYRIAVNEAINFARRRRRERPLDPDIIESQGVSVDHLARIERDELIQGALRALTPDHRVVVVLKYFLELSYKEISEIVELPEKTVKSRLYEGREHLREALVQKGCVR
ncbi:MAG: sigma-70 family RNA polymerase sigma factor [Candidatus Eisenbacteria bacterium]|nr:sigma-70 family RNA polymerase sigma factor [Candidatus Eisenbacteria bacterium]